MPALHDDLFFQVEHLSRIVPEKRIVDDVSFGVRRGEVLAIAGPSGSGKTSLLRLLNRLDEPTSGSVWIEDVDYRTIPPRELRRRVGMVMQRPFLFPGTVADNIRFGPLQRQEYLSPDEVENLLTQVSLRGYARRGVAQLSGGEAQRVSIARALANQPAALLLDEPTSALDESLKRQVEDVVLKVVRENALTGVIVTHDMAQAARLAGRILILEQGRVQRIGTVEEVLRAE